MFTLLVWILVIGCNHIHKPSTSPTLQAALPPQKTPSCPQTTMKIMFKLWSMLNTQSESMTSEIGDLDPEVDAIIHLGFLESWTRDWLLVINCIFVMELSWESRRWYLASIMEEKCSGIARQSLRHARLARSTAREDNNGGGGEGRRGVAELTSEEETVVYMCKIHIVT